MADASVSIGGDASGAIAACAAAQGAIDGLTGKTVHVNIDTSGGGAGGMGNATKGMDDFGRSAERAGRSTRGMGDDLGRAGGHMGRMADDAGKLRDHLAAVDNVLRGGAPDSIARSGAGMRSLANEADRARDSIGALHSGSSGMRAIENSASSAGRSMGEIGAGAESAQKQVLGMYRAVSRAESTFSAGPGGVANKLGFGDQSRIGAAPQRQASSFAADASGAVSKLSDSKGLEVFGSRAERMGSQMAGSGKEMERLGDKSTELARTVGAAGNSFASNPMLKSFMGMMGSIDNLGAHAGGALGSLGSAIDGVKTPTVGASTAIRGLGMASLYSAAGMGILTGAVAGVGLAGVGEDFAHNSQLMHAGGQAVRGFNREFSAMKAETSAAGSAPMAGVAASMKGVGHELASLGAANIAPVLNSVASLGTQATQAMQKLAPSIGPATQALTAVAGAVIGAFGDSGPAVASFANTVSQASPGLQKLMDGVISTAGAVGSFVVGLAGGIGDAEALTSDMWGSGSATKGSAGTPGVFDPSKPFTGMLPDGKGGFTQGPGEGGATAPTTSLVPPRTFSDMATAGGHSLPMSAARQPSSDGDWAKGMTGAQVLTAERARIGLPAVGKPAYGGMGAPPPDLGQPLPGAAPPASERGGAPRTNFGSGVRPIPASMAPSLGMGNIAPLNDISNAMQSQVQSGGGLGTATENHIQKAVHQASPAASAGGASLGAAMTGGMAQGVTSTQTVTDTVVIKHLKKMLDSSAEVLGVHSPSDEFDYLGRMSMAGYAQGFGAADSGTFGALSAAHEQASRFSTQGGMGQYAYANGGAPTSISVHRKSEDPQDPSQDPSNPLLSTSSTSMAPPVNHYGITGMSNIQAHNDRAGVLAQGRADLHAKAMSHLGVTNPATGQKWQDPSRADSNPFAGTSRDPFGPGGASYKAPSLKQRAGNLWDNLNQNGPQDKDGPWAGAKKAVDTSQAPRVGGPGSSGGGASMPSSIAARLGLDKAGGPGLKNAFSGHGEAMTQGVSVGIAKGTPAAQNQMGQFARGMQNRHKKEHGISSPSTVFATDGMNMAAGVGVGFTAGTPMATSEITTAAAQMSAAIAGPLNNQGLQLGFSYATNIVDGATRTLKNTNFQASGTPQIGNQQAAAALGQQGLMGPGSGASVYATPSVGFVGAGSAAQLAAAMKAGVSSQPIHIYLDSQLIQTMIRDENSNLFEQLFDASKGANG